jgi:hypothetical protein
MRVLSATVRVEFRGKRFETLSVKGTDSPSFWKGFRFLMQVAVCPTARGGPRLTRSLAGPSAAA